MLSENATKLLIGLCNKINGKEYVIYSWDEVAKANEEELPIDEIKEIFEEARLNQCLSQKYKDDDEVCFAVTDKALLIKQDYELIKKAEVSQEKLIKTDESGNSVIVLPKTSHEVAQIQKLEKKKLSFRLGAFIYGILGGILGGGIVCGIMLLIQLLGA